MASNSKADAISDLLPLDAEAFKTHRTGAGRSKTVLDVKLLARIKELITANGGMMGNKFFTSNAAGADAYNDNRATAAKLAEKEAPERITVEADAMRLARKDAARFTPYVNAVADELGKAASLRVRNDGTADIPNCRWAFVLVNHRERKEKEATTATAPTA